MDIWQTGKAAWAGWKASGPAAATMATRTFTAGWVWWSWGNTYRQVKEELSPGAWPYDGVPCLVCTHRPLQDPGVETVSGPPEQWLPAWKERVQGDVWICGGASLAGQLMEQGLIDEYVLTVCPVLLGEGIPLFEPGRPTALLDLTECRTENGMVLLRYVPRRTDGIEPAPQGAQ